MELFDFARTKNAKNSGLSFSLLMTVYVVLSFFGQAVLSSCFERDSLPFIALSSLFSVLSIIFILLILHPNRNSAVKFFNAEKFNPIWILPAITLSIGMFLALGFINGTIGTALKNAGLYVPNTKVPLSNVWQLLLFTVVLAVFPAVFEEAFFRGLVLQGLNGTRAVISSLVVGFVFAIYHCSCAQLVYQFIYGFLLTMLAIKAKSAIPSMISHFINNFGVLMLTYLNVNVNLYDYVLIIVGSIILIGTGLFVFLYSKNTESVGVKTKAKIKDFTIFSLFGVVICIALIVTGLFA